MPDNKVNIEDIFTGEVRTVPRTDLVKALFDGNLRFAVSRGATDPTSSVSDGTDKLALPLDDYPEHLVAIARYRLEIIRPLLEMDSRLRTAATVEAHVCDLRAKQQATHTGSLRSSISVGSIYRWMRDYTQAGCDLRALIPNTSARGGKGVSRLKVEANEIIDAVIQDKYLVREMVTIDDVVREIAVRIHELNTAQPKNQQIAMPSRSTVMRKINALDVADRFAAKHGKRAARRHLSQYGDMEPPQYPLERVEIDHTRSDLIVVDDRDNLPLGKMTVTYCLDIATRYPLGYYMGFEPPGYLAVMECLYHAIRPKENVRERYETSHDWIAYGVPSTLVIDNGKEFIGRDLQDACLLLGIVLQQTPIQTPHFKPGIERWFRSLNTMLFHTVPGTTFSNIQMRGDYDSVQQACVYLSDVDKMTHTFILDIYAERYHRGLQGVPARRWEAATQYGFAPRLPPSAEELRILLARVTERAIFHYGIELESLRYNCHELAALRTRLKGTQVKIKYHPGDLSRIHVYDPFDKRYIEVPALAQEYTQNLSLWKHRIIRSAALAEQDTVDLAALGRARRKIQEVVEAGRERKKTSTRARNARWDMAGKSSREMDLAPKHDHITTQEHRPLASSPSSPILPDLETDNGDDWDVDFSLPKSRRDIH